MFDFRLKVFTAVAKRLSFTKASEEMNISQPAVSKHIRELENELKSKLFDRKGNKIELTIYGQTLLNYAEKVRNINRDFEFEINQLKNIEKGTFKIGCSTTIANYILPKILANFNYNYPEIKIELTVNNSEKISELLEKNEIDCGLTEGLSVSSQLDYFAFMKDEIVLVTSNKSMFNKDAITRTELLKHRFVSREKGSGTQEIIKDALKKYGLNYNDLNTTIQLGSNESIKNYILNSDVLAFLSVHTILQELQNNTLSIIDVEDLIINRKFYLITPKGNQSTIVNLFKKFIINNQ
jgi:LysR family transcriptional regulator, transcriptional activator of the cysJI operon